jgi:hypothetical protein
LQNTIILIVQQVSDNRGGNQNNRYITRQIQSNFDVKEQIVIIIQDQNTVSVGGSNTPSLTGSSSAAQSTGSANASSANASSANIGTYQSGLSQFGGYTPNIDLLPAEVNSLPSFNFGAQGVDPAIIIQENQAVFVEFVDQSKESKDQSSVTTEIITDVSGGGSNII